MNNVIVNDSLCSNMSTILTVVHTNDCYASQQCRMFFRVTLADGVTYVKYANILMPAVGAGSACPIKPISLLSCRQSETTRHLEGISYRCLALKFAHLFFVKLHLLRRDTIPLLQKYLKYCKKESYNS